MIEINRINWRILFVYPQDPNLYRSDGSLTYGMCDNRTKIIYINAFLEKTLLWDVIVHELTHAALFSYGYNLDKFCHEELIADFVAKYGQEIINIAINIYSQYINKRGD